jgi:hypothetical protein
VLNSLEQDRRVPGGIEEFVREHIDRLETLHVLLLLHATAHRSWTARQVSVERQSSTYSAETSLRQLGRAGLLVRDEGLFRFRPHTSERAEQAAWLVWWYQASPHSVMSLILYGRRMPS